MISPSSQVEIQRWVNVEAVNFRNGPGVSYSVIQVLTANNPVQVLGRSGRWVQVEWVSGKDDAIQGWIFGRFLSDNPLTQKELESLKSANSATEVGVSKQKRVYMWALALLAIAVIYLLFKGLFKKRPWGTITGRAYVTDGDGIRVSGYNIRLAGLDAPEWDQFAKHQHGYWFNHVNGPFTLGMIAGLGNKLPFGNLPALDRGVALYRSGAHRKPRGSF